MGSSFGFGGSTFGGGFCGGGGGASFCSFCNLSIIAEFMPIFCPEFML